ncbi:MAG: secondary thiamine-phosphate synthase enzyme YjbQ [Myxococcales bacterium]|nr:secondary thiamine-phosphate synthase enzyme YjbQ [Myxococcales bacterium]
MHQIFTVATQQAKQSLDITARVAEIVKRSGVSRGLCHVMVLHSTAAVILNENDDPDVGVDVLTALDRAVPDHAGWLHDRVDNNAHAHIKAAILGASELMPIEGGRLQLGTWQGIMLMEFDGPRRRKVAVRILTEE